MVNSRLVFIERLVKAHLLVEVLKPLVFGEGGVPGDEQLDVLHRVHIPEFMFNQFVQAFVLLDKGDDGGGEAVEVLLHYVDALVLLLLDLLQDVRGALVKVGHALLRVVLLQLRRFLYLIELGDGFLVFGLGKGDGFGHVFELLVQLEPVLEVLLVALLEAVLHDQLLLLVLQVFPFIHLVCF